MFYLDLSASSVGLTFYKMVEQIYFHKIQESFKFILNQNEWICTTVCVLWLQSRLETSIPKMMGATGAIRPPCKQENKPVELKSL